MKNLLPLILFFAFALNSCENKEPTPANPINDVLDFNELLFFMGGELDQLRDQIPGQYHKEVINIVGELVLFYHMIPANVIMEDTLVAHYSFAEDTLKDIVVVAPYDYNPLNLANQMTTKAAEQLGEGEYRFLWNVGTNTDYEKFTDAKEVWDFVEANDSITSYFWLATGKWMVDKYEVSLRFRNDRIRPVVATIWGPILDEDPMLLREIIIDDSCGLQLIE